MAIQNKYIIWSWAGFCLTSVLLVLFVGFCVRSPASHRPVSVSAYYGLSWGQMVGLLGAPDSKGDYFILSNHPNLDGESHANVIGGLKEEVLVDEHTEVRYATWQSSGYTIHVWLVRGGGADEFVVFEAIKAPDGIIF